MIDVCEQYAAKLDILFNGNKTKLLFLKVDMLVLLPQVLW